MIPTVKAPKVQFHTNRRKTPTSYPPNRLMQILNIAHVDSSGRHGPSHQKADVLRNLRKDTTDLQLFVVVLAQFRHSWETKHLEY